MDNRQKVDFGTFQIGDVVDTEAYCNDTAPAGTQINVTVNRDTGEVNASVEFPNGLKMIAGTVNVRVR